jgi:RNA recognition motif-containing protein
MKAKRRIHVSNIPYELKKEDIIELFEMAGPVIECELIHEQNTNKFKGSAFIEYPDQYTAKSALRNLNRIEIKGRSLKISEAHADRTGPDVGLIINDDTLSNDEDLEQKSTSKEIEEVVKGLQPSQKAFLLGAMKDFCESNKEEFKHILTQDEKTYELILALQKEIKFDRPRVNNSRSKYDTIDSMMSGSSYPSHNMNQMYQQQPNQSIMMNMPRDQSYNTMPIQNIRATTYSNPVQGNIMTNQYNLQPTLSPTGNKIYTNQFGSGQIGMGNQNYRSDTNIYGQYGMQGHQQPQPQQQMYGHQTYHHMGDMDVQMGQHGQMSNRQQYTGQFGDGNMGMYGGNQGNMMYYNQQGNNAGRKY